MLNTMQRIQENVFMLSGSSELTPNVPIAAARHWYNRIKNYAWDKPVISTKSTQFTQLIWAASQQVIFCLWFYHVDFPYSSMFYKMSFKQLHTSILNTSFQFIFYQNILTKHTLYISCILKHLNGNKFLRAKFSPKVF